MTFEEIIKKLNLNISNLIKIIEGGNSFVMKAKLNDNSLVAVKLYKGEPSRIQRMLTREQKAIEFLAARNFLNIPEILEVRQDLGLIVYRWIEGESPVSDKKSMEAIMSMCSSLDQIEKKGDNFESAIDAAFSLYDIDFQITERINLFRLNSTSEFNNIVLSLLEEKLDKYKLLFNENRVFSACTISISDLGTHNMLYANNLFKFVDFEFFGRDSLDKLVGDFLLHPQNKFGASEILSFKEYVSSNLGWHIENLNPILPILAIKWAAIAFKREIIDIERSISQERTFTLLEETNGMKYLKYFEYLISSKPDDSISTFHHFTAKI